MCNECQNKYSLQFQQNNHRPSSSNNDTIDRYRTARIIAPDIIADEKGIISLLQFY